MRFGAAAKARLAACLTAIILLAGCSGSSGDTGPSGAQGPPGVPGDPAPEPEPDPTDPNLGETDPLPGVVMTITGLSGATGANGAFQVGDTISMTCTLTKGDGSYLGMEELDYGRIYVSGPTTNYQRVLPSVSDLRAASVENPDGSYTYTFAAPIPAVYAAPLSDSASFDADDGELAGQPLLSGTYTVGIEAYKNYFVGDETFRDPVNVTKDFLFGTATVLEPREVVTRNNCNQCHENFQAHSGRRLDLKLCVLCHTAGSEDNDPLGLTTGVTLEFKVMVHRIHNGAHLPSVQGVTTNPDGSRNYGVTPQPLVYMDGEEAVEFSEVGFPRWPNLNIAMPRDTGFSLLTSAQQTQDNNMRFGVTDCAACHGDPDGAGPMAAPAQGGFSTSKPSRAACGSCHDDVVWSQPYVANGLQMPAQNSDAACLTCHPASGDPLSATEGHLHPLKNPAIFPGLNVDISSVSEAGTNNGNAKVDTGEKVQVAFTVKNDAGTDVAASTLTSMSLVLSGPTTNYNLLISGSIPPAVLGAGPNYSVNLPYNVGLERVGVVTAGADVWTANYSASQVPTVLWTTGVTTTIRERTATTGGSTTTTAATALFRNFVDVASVTNFARNDYVVIDDGAGSEEYAQITLVDGSRLWLSNGGSNNGLRFAHASGATVKEVTLTTRTVTTQYTLNAAAGTITEVAGFTTGNVVLASYTTDYVMPSVYPPPINDGPTLDETWGEWAGKAIVPGTYSVNLWGRGPTMNVNPYGENTAYNNAVSPGKIKNFLVGSATEIEPYYAISSGDNCLRCHQDLWFHGGGRRGFDTCILCHGTAGFEDRARYTAANAPETAGATPNFRTMVHKFHMGEELPDKDTYGIVGFGSAAYPNNYGFSQFGEIVFPAMADGVKNCRVCHGASNDRWTAPLDRTHPSGQTMATRNYRAACGACHSTTAAAAHMDSNTSPFTGAEACAVCHGEGRLEPVEVKHKTR